MKHSPNGRITMGILATKLDGLITLVTEHALDDKTQFQEFRRLLSGQDDAPGMKGRLDRLELAERNRIWHVRAIWVALIGAASAGVLQWLVGATRLW